VLIPKLAKGGMPGMAVMTIGDLVVTFSGEHPVAYKRGDRPAVGMDNARRNVTVERHLLTAGCEPEARVYGPTFLVMLEEALAECYLPRLEHGPPRRPGEPVEPCGLCGGEREVRATMGPVTYFQCVDCKFDTHSRSENHEAE
jgi:hypothetical protein